MRQAVACALVLIGLGLFWTGGGSARVTDATPAVSVGDASVAEGNDGIGNLVFPLTLSARRRRAG